jgi:hypothetical protein
MDGAIRSRSARTGAIAPPRVEVPDRERLGGLAWTRRRNLKLVLACTLMWLWMPATGHAQASTEACPPPPSAQGTTVAPTTPSTGTLHPPAQEIVACVGSQPIAGSLFGHWEDVASRAAGLPDSHGLEPSALVGEVMGFLISSDWVLGEAHDLRVQVSDREVRRRFDRIRREQFPKQREFRAFLRSSGQTVADVLLRVRLNLLSTRIQSRVTAGKRGARAEEALTRFARAFKSKWRAQTYCSPQFAVADCGHVQTVL